MADNQTTGTNWMDSGPFAKPTAPADIPWNPQTLAALFQQTPSPDSTQGSLGPATLKQLANVGANTAQATGPYQKGVAKALQEYGYKHGAEALSAGVPPEHIQSHDLMTGGQQPGMAGGQPGGNPADIMAILKTLIGSGGNQGQPAAPGGQPMPSAGGQPQTALMGGQQSNPVTDFFSKLGITNTPANQALLTESALGKQKLQAGQPAEIAEPQARAAYTNGLADYQQMINQGNKPIDPEQYLGAYSNMYQKAYEAYQKDEETGNQITQSALDQYNKLADTTRNAFQKGMGQSNPEMQKTLQASAASLKASIDARTNFHNFMMQNSPSQVISGIKNKLTSNTDNGVSGLKVGDKFNGEKVVNIQRIK